jgi:hypothetical protein
MAIRQVFKLEGEVNGLVTDRIRSSKLSWYRHSELSFKVGVGASSTYRNLGRSQE